MKPWLSFDFDGTLADCRPRQEVVTADILSRLGVPGPPPHLWRRKRAGLTTAEALLRGGVPAPAVADFRDLWLQEIEAPHYLTLDRDFAWTRAVLGSAGGGFRLLLLSSRGRPEGLRDTLDRLDLAKAFDAIEIVPIAGAAAAKARVLRRYAPLFHCGDTETDARAAAAAGVPFWAVSCGQRNASFLKQYPQRFLTPDIRSFKRIIADSRGDPAGGLV